MSARVWLQAFTASLVVATVLSCTCLPATPSEQVCRADYAARVRVLNSGFVTNNNRVYRVQTQQIYKSTVGTSSVNTRFLYTATNSAACGVILQQGQTYFITGHFSNDSPLEPGPPSGAPAMQSGYFSPGIPLRRVRIGLCGLQQQWYRGYRAPSCGPTIGPGVIRPRPRPIRPVRPYRPVRPRRFPRNYRPVRRVRRRFES